MDSVMTIFERNGVEEIRELEKKTRHEIELKKEELRQMVGERYRDLIEAADKITEMKKCSEIVTNTVKDIQEFTSARRKSALKPRASQLGASNESRFLEIAAETKVLMEMPEEIWLQVEAGNMITASFLYLQSRQVLKNLSLDGNHSYSPILQWIPMLGQQAQAVANLRLAILKQCHARIRDHSLDLQSLSEALCSIILLEEVSIETALGKLLESRREAINEILTEAEIKSGSYYGMSTKGKICAGLEVLVKTASQVYELFCCEGERKSAVEIMLRKCTEEPEGTEPSESFGLGKCFKIWTSCVPKNLSLQKVKFNITSYNIEDKNIQQLNTQWLSACKSILNKGIADLLQFTNSAKDLTSVREAAMEILDCGNEIKATSTNNNWSINDLGETVHVKTKWQQTCQAVFNHEVDVWDELLQSLFLNKLKSIVAVTFQQLLNDSKALLEKQGGEKGTSTSKFLWNEHENDISSTMAWSSWQQRKTSDHAGLTLKSLSITPNVHRLCEGLDTSVKKLLDDVNNYVVSVVGKSGPNTPHKRSVSTSENLIENNVECQTVYGYLKLSSGEFFTSLLEFLSKMKEQLKNKANKTDYTANEDVLSKALFLSRVCRNLFKLCHSFHDCYITKPLHNQPLRRHMSESHASGDMKSTTDTSQWEAIVEAMSVQSLNFMSICTNAILSPALVSFEESLLNSASGGNILLSLSLWDSITVEEESETGDTVKSQIKVPASTMSFTQELLFTVCTELEKIGGYSISRSTLRELSNSCLQGVMRAYSSAKTALARDDSSLHGQTLPEEDASPSQVWALQSLFDLRYLHNILQQSLDAAGKNPEVGENDLDEEHPCFTYTELVDWLEGYIDPFDLDVFSPHLTHNIQRYSARTSTLFGILVSSKVTSSQKLFSSKDSHNVLPLMPDCGRFPLLPIANSSRSYGDMMTSSLPQLPLAHALRQLTSSVDQREERERDKSSSLYSKLGALSSSWLSMSSSYTEN
uniref:conserved oligomeric Golgi complex subunit 1-like n=1 Tax=Ciona intestinalis TaxID=7719 RepID=UPI000180C9AD|nr:conserved oligomeric Golgi complex subunit 1-like [Ciona intestinalis]|eukprot:XP_026692510.1 conserved oligomeric Golgi complex subunit 1-like [Ciona intestinalis]